MRFKNSHSGIDGQLLYSRALTGSSDAITRAVVLGHLTITIPVIVAIGIVVDWGLYHFGPSLWPYYITGGIASHGSQDTSSEDIAAILRRAGTFYLSEGQFIGEATVGP